jgi:predicted RNase H-like HicB family nuclease
MRFHVEIDREDDGRWIAEIPALAGCMEYGTSRDDAVARAESLALRILADRIEAGEPVPDLGETFLVPA